MSKTTVLLAGVCVFGWVSSAIPHRTLADDNLAPEVAPSPRIAQELIVHEWGTFTSFSGSDGIQLDYRPLAEKEDLPYFVLHRSANSIFAKKNLRSRIRMETPVTYFYPNATMEIRASVGFPRGLLTEYYPPVQSIFPSYDRKLANSSGEILGNALIDWGPLTVIPMSELNDSRLVNLLDASQYPHYALARETDSAIVRPSSNAENPIPFADEKFLFYRGVGNFEMPIRIEADEEGNWVIHNSHTRPIESIFLLDVNDGSTSLAKLDHVASLSSVKMPKPELVTRSNLNETVAKSLVAQGLYEKEAWAMVHCWEDAWFAEPGKRVFYSVPQSITDSILPLRIEPTPTKTVRVLVARCELMSRQLENSVLQAVHRSAEEHESLRV
jgi:hypothetical protein